ncbi:HNH endonuclease [Pyruvatibacter mobilis]|uniref:HNH endonuclease n=1 Tax=Pyruvatibacter mobilis TaxID=1712261 RepID=UPI003BB03309
MLDTLFFKKLAHNDTGKARGHQGGIVIPKDIAQFFPPLPAVTSATGPTVDTQLVAELFVDGRKVGTVRTRYQHQTWGGKRSPERRLTDNLGVLRNEAAEDDILLFSKSLVDDGYIQLHLIRQDSDQYEILNSKIGEARWGPVDPDNPPVSLEELTEAENYIAEQAQRPPYAFDADRKSVEAKATRKARDKMFRVTMLEQYEHRCAFTGRKFLSPVGSTVVGLDAAHIVPVSDNGSDHPANGFLLTKDIHWAFDQGMIGVSEERQIIVPAAVSAIPGNEFLADLNGQHIREARAPDLQAVEEALAWHRQNKLLT